METQEENSQEEKEQQTTNEHEEENSLESEDLDSDTVLLVANLTEQIETLQDKLLRQMAESENIRNRSTKLVDEAREYAILGFARDLIPVVDNLSRALEYLPENIDDDMKNLVEGIKMTKNELSTVFKKNALESIEPQSGEKFDYNSHHAISQVVTEDQQEGTIVNTMQAGYRIKDRLIRPAAVTVAKRS